MGRTRPMQLLTALRVVATSAAATIVGVSRAVARREHQPRTRLDEGDLAPDFTLTGSDGQAYRLSSFRGKRAVVIAWFPKAFTGGCTRQCVSMSARHAELGRAQVAVF